MSYTLNSPLVIYQFFKFYESLNLFMLFYHATVVVYVVAVCLSVCSSVHHKLVLSQNCKAYQVNDAAWQPRDSSSLVL